MLLFKKHILRACPKKVPSRYNLKKILRDGSIYKLVNLRGTKVYLRVLTRSFLNLHEVIARKYLYKKIKKNSNKRSNEISHKNKLQIIN